MEKISAPLAPQPADIRTHALEATPDEPCPHGAVLSLSFGILLFWSMSDQATAYLIGGHPRLQAAAKMVLAIVICIAIPLAVIASFVQRTLLPDKCKH